MDNGRPVWPWALGGAAAVIVVVGLLVGGFLIGRGGGETSTPQAVTTTPSPKPSVAVKPSPKPTPVVTVTVTPKPVPARTASNQSSGNTGESLFSLNPDSQEFAQRADAILCSGQYLPEISRSDSPAWPVLIAQRQLNSIYIDHPADSNNITLNGVFGPITERQTARFQYDSYATVTGAVGPETWQRFRDIRCNGAAVPAQRAEVANTNSFDASQICSWQDYPTVIATQGTPDQVRALQAALAGQGYDPGPIDGAFGAKTDSALRAYQADHN